VFYVVFIADELRGGDKGSGNNIKDDVLTHLEVFSNMSLTSACSAEEVFF
jgi:hypothetical protein